MLYKFKTPYPILHCISYLGENVGGQAISSTELGIIALMNVRFITAMIK